MLYQCLVLFLMAFNYSKGATFTATQGSNQNLYLTIGDVPPSTFVTIHNPVNAELFKARNTSIIPIYTNLGRRVTNAHYTDITRGRIDFTLTGITLEDAGDYTASYSSWCTCSSKGATLTVYGKPSKPVITTDGTTLVAGDTLTLNCFATSNSKPENHNLHMSYRWYRNRNREANGRQLHIHLKKSDNGAEFTCRAYENSSLFSDDSDGYNVNVQYGTDTILLQPSNPHHVLLDNATLEPVSCEADCNPLCRYRWVRNGEDVSQTAVLEIENIQHHQSGVYTCIAWNRHGAYSKDVLIYVLDTILPLIPLRAKCKNKGRVELLLLVQTGVNQNFEIQASTDGVEFKRFEAVFHYPWQQFIIANVYGLRAFTKYFFKVISTDSENVHDQLSCITTAIGNETFIDENKAISWTLDPIPPSSSLVTVLHPSNGVLFSARGSDVILYPSDLGRRVNDTNNTNTFTGHLEFTLNGITLEDAGNYIARYVSESGVTIKHIAERLLVYEKPSRPTCTIAYGVTPVVGNTLTLKCSSTSNSKPDDNNLQMMYKWYRYGVDVLFDDRYTANGQYLQMKSIQKSDIGVLFTCKSYETKSVLSDLSIGYIINANYAPDHLVMQPSSQHHVLMENATLDPIHCRADCNPPCKYRWLLNWRNLTTTSVLKLENIQNYESGIYSCLAWNQYGTTYSSDLSIVVLDALLPPLQLRAECRSSGMAELLIQVQKYVNASLDVQASSDGEQFNYFKSVLIYPGQQMIITKINDLQANTTYYFKVISTSRFGTIESQNNLNCTTPANAEPETQQTDDGNMMFNAGIAMIVVAFVVILMSAVITVVILRRNLRPKEHNSNSKHYEDVGSNHRQDTSKQNDHYQEIKHRPEVYQDLGKREVPTSYDGLTTRKIQDNNQEMKQRPGVYQDLGQRDVPTAYEDLTTRGETQGQNINTEGL